ncbi:MAG: lipoyl(octanoyl) transferase LipB [Candidatus Neomarinimicrobiota bacterium]|jgi:lipoyl(octanoyl) transferase|nr:lipoyl(octanoyl) transferase LipB [Candidatus Neomarinimicrobiota bacterium]MEC9006580.1 lipoyl(octanoyl) transferase LipB [Candidatus Neomarinimicrobiota bacterium]MEC9437517.1 lipoyl(octanoyl) transferase LipB [Candidatus Neomarinimicrobiota bacterium]MEC9474476.1 lipoyl(octanoyl) transferase LipB [Candidatus Neomarinimicrobiota bacterium]MED5247950.1 lipoyl(octanoyl) transferase LipB [Candidatus Neomarinimicrobiota bacterium]|tara:strand:+ start:305 stop:955 length:651 start_codon:yes stop_codon:yes gene_type:complete
MSQKINIVDLGRMDYKSAWDFQKEFHNKVLIGKETDTLFLVEHEPVYTLGKNANNNNLLKKANSNVKVFNVERGGDITYHGPGQLVGYPILDLHNYQKNISWFMRTLESILIETLSSFDIHANQKEGLTGVWVGDEKIGAQGVRISRWVTMHGFSLNVNTDLSYFDSIVPCGIVNCGITSMKKLLGKPQDMDLVKKSTVNAFNKIIVSSANKMEAV